MGACISSRDTTVIHVRNDHQMNCTCFQEPFAVSLYTCLYWNMHGIVFEISLCLPGRSGRPCRSGRPGRPGHPGRPSRPGPPWPPWPAWPLWPVEDLLREDLPTSAKDGDLSPVLGDLIRRSFRKIFGRCKTCWEDLPTLAKDGDLSPMLEDLSERSSTGPKLF